LPDKTQHNLSNTKTPQEHTWAPSTLDQKGGIICSEKVSILVLIDHVFTLIVKNITLVFLSKNLKILLKKTMVRNAISARPNEFKPLTVPII